MYEGTMNRSNSNEEMTSEGTGRKHHHHWQHNEDKDRDGMTMTMTGSGWGPRRTQPSTCPHHCKPLLTWGIVGANSDNKDTDDGRGKDNKCTKDDDEHMAPQHQIPTTPNNPPAEEGRPQMHHKMDPRDIHNVSWAISLFYSYYSNVLITMMMTGTLTPPSATSPCSWGSYMFSLHSIYIIYILCTVKTHAGTNTHCYLPVPAVCQPVGQQVTTCAGTGMGQAFDTHRSTCATA
jgi:hypothetical protein